MGTTLTGTTPQDTYDSLIKVTDNGPLSGTAKYLSDGLGNDSVLALSTSRVTIGGTNPYIGLLTIYGSASLSSGFGLRNSAGTAAGYFATYAAGSGSGSTDISIGSAGFLDLSTAGVERMRITSAGNVGIGTSAPEAKLDIKGSAAAGSVGMFIENQTASATNNSADIYFGTWEGSSVAGITNARISALNVSGPSAATNLDFYTYNGASSAKRISVTADGLTFNGDTAAANALDDYEEGTWTMAVSFGGASVGVTVSNTAGTYTKIGRQVTVNGYLQLTSKGSSTGAAKITGLPFAIANNTANYSAPSLNCSAITFANQFQGLGVVGSTNIDLQEVTELGVITAITDADFADTSYVILSFTYFV
jgi:hypothetical protein